MTRSLTRPVLAAVSTVLALAAATACSSSNKAAQPAAGKPSTAASPGSGAVPGQTIAKTAKTDKFAYTISTVAYAPTLKDGAGKDWKPGPPLSSTAW